MRVLLVATLLLIGALAVADPTAARPQPPQCVHGGIELDLVVVTVRTTCGEGIVIEPNRDFPPS